MGQEKSTRKDQVIKVVLGTNIWISLSLNKRLTQNFTPVINDMKHFEIFMSNQMVLELGRVLTYPKIAEILEKSNVDPRAVLETVLGRVSLLTIREGTINEIKADESDNRILECALDSKASYIVTGDPHLLDMKEFKGIKILTASNFLSLVSEDY